MSHVSGAVQENSFRFISGLRDHLSKKLSENRRTTEPFQSKVDFYLCTYFDDLKLLL